MCIRDGCVCMCVCVSSVVHSGVFVRISTVLQRVPSPRKAVCVCVCVYMCVCVCVHICVRSYSTRGDLSLSLDAVCVVYACHLLNTALGVKYQPNVCVYLCVCVRFCSIVSV